MLSFADDGEWFDSWPGIQDIPQEDRPLEMFFGDDTPISLEEKQLWTDAYDEFGIPLRWQAGDVAVLCNMRYAHGRPGVHLEPDEERDLGVMLGPCKYCTRKKRSTLSLPQRLRPTISHLSLLACLVFISCSAHDDT